MSSNSKIEKNKLLLVEGADEVGFFKAYLEALKKDSIQIMQYNGKDNLENHLSILRGIPNFEILDNLIIVVDCDDNLNNSIKGVNNSLIKNNFTKINKTFEFINCNKNDNLNIALLTIPEENGALEDLCLSTLNKPHSDILELATQYIENIHSKYKTASRKRKAILHAYLSAFANKDKKGERNNYAGATLGMASQRGAWDFSSIYMQPYTEFFDKIS